MILHDKNQTWQPPDGHQLLNVRVQGGYILVEYIQPLPKIGIIPLSDHLVTVYVNNQGREVLRTEREEVWPAAEKPRIPVPVGRWLRFQDGFFVALEGIKEMIKSWRKK